MDWYLIKAGIVEGSGISRDALHILIGVTVQIGLACVLRLSVARLALWLVVLALALANEAFDLLWDVWPERERQLTESVKDLLTTMAIPTALLLLSRLAPARLVTPPPDDAGSP